MVSSEIDEFGSTARSLVSENIFLDIRPREKSTRTIFTDYAARHTRGPDFAIPGYMNMIPFARTEKFMPIIRDI